VGITEGRAINVFKKEKEMGNMLILMMLLAVFAISVIMFLIQYRLLNHSRDIRVIYENNTYGMIERTQLEESIVSGSIEKFFRSSDWVKISVDPMRKTNHGHSIERREIATC
jgi:hypothetical protein